MYLIGYIVCCVVVASALAFFLKRGVLLILGAALIGAGIIIPAGIFLIDKWTSGPQPGESNIGILMVMAFLFLVPPGVILLILGGLKDS